jgi:TonB family protein
MSSCSIDREFASAMLSGVMARVLSIASLLLIASYAVGQQVLPSAPEPKKPVSPFRVPIGIHADNQFVAQPGPQPPEKAPVALGEDFELINEPGSITTVTPAIKAYLQRVCASVKQHSFRLTPEGATDSLNSPASTIIQFSILKDGRVSDVKIVQSSENALLDRTAQAGITGAAPFQQLPQEVGADHLVMRIRFDYSPPAEKPKQKTKKSHQ